MDVDDDDDEVGPDQSDLLARFDRIYGLRKRGRIPVFNDIRKRFPSHHHAPIISAALEKCLVIKLI